VLSELAYGLSVGIIYHKNPHEAQAVLLELAYGLSVGIIYGNVSS
jgi:xanthosine utilization system XapX-like protein